MCIHGMELDCIRVDLIRPNCSERTNFENRLPYIAMYNMLQNFMNVARKIYGAEDCIADLDFRIPDASCCTHCSAGEGRLQCRVCC